MGNKSCADREKLLRYLKETQTKTDEFRRELKHQIQREEIDALNEKTMSSAGGSDLHGRNKKTEVGADVVETEYNPRTRHYEQVDRPGTGGYVKGMITYTARNTGTINDKKERGSRGGIIIHSNKEESKAKERLKEAIQREVEVVTGKWPSYEELKEQRAQDIANQLNRLEESTSQKEDDQSQR